MKELARHIEILLLHNDCVIIPDLGGLIVHHIAAQIDDTNKLFVAPYRSLGFNPLLDMNDSLLAESYMTVHDISYPEAIKHIKHDVELLKLRLEQNGSCELGDLGTLRIKEDGHYEFIPSNQGFPSPRLYGLSSFELPQFSAKVASMSLGSSYSSKIMMPLHPHSSNTSKHSLATIMSQIDNKPNPEEKTISIKVSVLRNIVVTAVAAIALVLFARPIAPNELTAMNSAQSEASMIAITNTMPSDEPNSELEIPVTNSETGIMDNIQDLARKIENIREKNTTPSIGNFTIVLGCSLPINNAKSYLKQVHDKGIKEAILIEYHSDNMIVYGNYAKSQDALPHLNDLAQQGLVGWIMQMKP